MTTDIEQSQWFVLKTLVGTEMKVKGFLDGWEKPIENFIPMKYEITKVRGRNQRVLVPAVSSLVFVRSQKKILEDFKYNILTFHKTPTYFLTETKEVFIDNQPRTKNVLAIVPDKQMESFIKIATQYSQNIRYYKPEEVNLVKGMKVRIIGGVFDGVEGCVAKTPKKRKKTIVVQIPGFCVATPSITPDLIEVIK